MKKINSRRVGAASALSLAMVFAGGISHAEQTIQGNQNSDSASSTSGTANGSNSNSFNTGASSSGTDANTMQNGKNSAAASQSGSAKGGDAVAGGQVVGAVGNDVTVQVTNNATDPYAVSGDADVDNDIFAQVGANAEASSGLAQVSQTGDNDFAFDQDATGSSGDAVGGAQVIGIVGGGEHTVQANNTADCELDSGCAVSGDLDLHNLADDLSVGAFAESGGDDAQSGQVGSNDAVGAQSAEGTTGDAVYGSQVSGLVGGSATVQVNNVSDCDYVCASSGDGEIRNAIGDDDVQIGATAFTDGGVANATQAGDNSFDLAQVADGGTGDALSGAQVTGGVGNGGSLVLQATNNSDDDHAESGDLDIDNEIESDLTVGAFGDADSDDDATATQAGDNSFVWAADAAGHSGDAVAGAQVSGAVNYDETTIQATNDAESVDAISGDVDVDNETESGIFIGASANGDGTTSATQDGDNSLDIGQVAEGTSGDAVGAAQISGVVGGDEVTVQHTNSGDTDTVESGDVDVYNDVDGGTTVGAYAYDDGDSVTVTQNGDNSAVIAQAVSGGSGDAVAGSQIAGIAGDSGTTATLQQTNTAEGDATSGDLDLDNDIEAYVGAFADGSGTTLATATASGDDSADFTQAIEGSSGDAVAASQISGVVAGDGAVQNTNNPDGSDNDAVSGAVTADNDLDSFVGTRADGATDTATATQNGDADLVFAQGIDVASGDAVADSQVTGTVGMDAAVQQNNNSDGPTATSGTVTGNNDAVGDVGTTADPDTGGDGIATQNGDASVAGDQTLETPTGDAVAGSQIVGDA